MTEKEKQEIADIVIKKMLEVKKEMDKDLFNINDVLFTLLNTQLSEEELLVGELSRLMTLMNIYEEKEEYEKAAIIKNKVDKINNKLDQIDNQKRGDYD
jgi:sulfur relay (sulfurtransferase) DsrF/TusC family protein|tara:strand:- start:284 stop:580 length:297 start_codon:yes stop_codon:yes gene_type:complete